MLCLENIQQLNNRLSVCADEAVFCLESKLGSFRSLAKFKLVNH